MLVWRWPNDELTLGTQLIVSESQEAILFKGGQAVDHFGPGTHTLATDNLPLLGNLINLPFGGRTPFAAEVYFINRHAKLDVKWGTLDPFRVRDPIYQVIVPLRSYGQIGLRVENSRSLVLQLVGSLHSWDHAQAESYFRGLVVMKVKDCISSFVKSMNISAIDIADRLQALSGIVKTEIESEFARFGLEVVNFYIMSVNISDDDPSLLKIQEILAAKAEIDQLGENYRLKKTFDTMDRAASNDSGGAGLFLAGSLGANLAQNFAMPPMHGTAESNRTPAARLAALQALLEQDLISQAEYDSKRQDILGSL